MATTTPTSTAKTTRYVILAVLALPVLGLLYFLLSYLAVNLFMGIDLSAYGQAEAGGWLGYALLGLGLGAAGGAVAAQRRYRLHSGLVAGAGALTLALLGLAVVTLATADGPPELAAAETKPYQAGQGRVSCGACTAITATTTRPAQNNISYEAANLLRRDSTRAWISETPVAADNPLLPAVQLHVAIAPLAGHQLVGLRLRNGYCKTSGVYHSFSRAQICQLRLPSGAQQAWTLPDAPHREYFLPVTAAAGDSTRLTLTISDTYAGDNHPEVALAWLVPVFELVSK